MKPLSWLEKVFVAAFTISCCLLTVAAAHAAAPAGVVNFAKTTNPKNQLGFMHGALDASRNRNIRQAVIDRANQLTPGLWRGSHQAWSFNLPVVQASGATPVHILSNLWLQPVSNPDKPKCRELFWGRPLPFQDLKAWESWVSLQADSLAAMQPSGDIWVDIWNEPDWPKFWPVKRNDACFSKSLLDTDGSKWFNTFLTAERVLRKKLGVRVKIVGPNTATRVTSWTERLLAFCASKGCKLDAVGWHIAGGTQGSIDLIPRYTAQMRSSLAGNAAWRRASAGAATQIWMTEYMPIAMRLMPGAYVSFWYSLERAGIDKSALAEWSDEDAALNSLLARDGSPRSIWWAAKAYADGRSSRVWTQTNQGAYSLIASRSGINDTPQVLLGNNSSTNQTIQLSLQGLSFLGLTKYIAPRYSTLPVVTSGSSMPNLPHPINGQKVSISKNSSSIRVAVPKGAAVLVELAGE